MTMLISGAAARNLRTAALGFVLVVLNGLCLVATRTGRA